MNNRFLGQKLYLVYAAIFLQQCMASVTLIPTTLPMPPVVGKIYFSNKFTKRAASSEATFYYTHTKSALSTLTRFQLRAQDEGKGVRRTGDDGDARDIRDTGRKARAGASNEGILPLSSVA